MSDLESQAVPDKPLPGYTQQPLLASLNQSHMRTHGKSTPQCLFLLFMLKKAGGETPGQPSSTRRAPNRRLPTSKEPKPEGGPGQVRRPRYNRSTLLHTPLYKSEGSIGESTFLQSSLS